MDIQTVLIENSIGIKDGMGVDRFFLDLREMDGTIAFAGPTGVGKSTVMVNCQPYPQVISRPDPALVNHFYGRNGIRDLSFIHNGDLFRTLLKIDSEQRRSEGYIYVNDSSKSENDGKISTYKKFIVNEFGSTDLFFNSVFAAQNSPGMSSIDPADFKALMIEFLGRRLEILKEQFEMSKSCSNILLGTLETIGRDMEKQHDILTLHQNAATELARTEIVKKDMDEGIVSAGMTIVKLESGLRETGKSKMEMEGYQERIKALEEDHRDIGLDIDVLNGNDNQARLGFQAERDKIEQESGVASGVLLQKEAIEGAAEREKRLTQDVNNFQTKKVDADKRLNDSRETLNAKRKEANDAQASYNTSLYSKRDGRRIWENKSTGLETQIDTLEITLEHKRNAVLAEQIDARDRFKKKQNEIWVEMNRAEMDTKAAESDPKIMNLRQRLNLCKEASDAKRGTVTCTTHGVLNHAIFDCNSEDCPQIEKALRAEKEIPVLKNQIREAQETKEKLLKALSTKSTSLVVEEKFISEGIERLENIDAEINTAYAQDLKAKTESLATERDLIDKEIVRVEQQEKDLTEAYDKANAEKLDAICSLTIQTNSIERESEGFEKDITGIQKEIDEAKELAARLPEIKIAEARLKDLSDARDKLEARMKQSAEVYRINVVSKERKMAEIQTTINITKEKIDPDINDRITRLEAKIRNEKFALGANQDELKRLEAKSYGLQANVLTADAAALEMERLRKRRVFISGHQAEWKYMQGKCGPNGIQALEINSVAPTITHEANMLLSGPFGPQEMIKLQTLDPITGKEVLRIVAINKEGKEVVLGNRSGGQQRYGLRPIRLGMTMVSKQRSGKNYLSAFSDEEDDGLDPVTAVKFTQLFGEFLKQGEFKKGFYISHKAKCTAIANHVIALGPGGVAFTGSGPEWAMWNEEQGGIQ